ncbi:hypothetical protein AB0I55_06835 [Actinocatenispora sera]|uniref:hypothetical protein n=1 Tax=Actinocatenispora sera TaxID=390989 RepID=UPI0033EC2094
MALAAVRLRRSARIDLRPTGIGRLVLLLDFGAALLGGVLAIAVSDHPWVGFGTGFSIHPLSMYLWGCVMLPAVWVMALAVHGSYRRGRSLLAESRRIVLAALSVVAIVSFTVLLLAPDLSRSAVATVLLVDTTLVLCGRMVRRARTIRAATDRGGAPSGDVSAVRSRDNANSGTVEDHRVPRRE